jgi:ATP-binding cassette subfamily F protein 3
MILDEPTNHLDIDAREALLVALAAYSGAVVLISHDRHLIETSADRLWVVAGGTVRPWEGDMDEYRRAVLDGGRIAGPQSFAAAGSGANTASNADRNRQKTSSDSARGRRRDAAVRRAETAPLRQKIKASEALMEKLRKEIQDLDLRLSDSGLYDRDPDGAARLAKARADAARALAEAEESWLAASAELEAADVG